MRRPGRKRPSLIKYSAELEVREDSRDEDEDGGRGGVAENAVAATAKSIVGESSELLTGTPQEGQKRIFVASSMPHEEHLDMADPGTG